MNIIEKIKSAKAEEINDILLAVLARYRELYPGWEISTFSLEKSADKNEQLDRMIEKIERMREQ